MSCENLNETELLTLMLNKNEFIQYIKQQYENNGCYTQLETIIWAIHFNIPKYQRLPLLENIIHQSMAYIRTCYGFLPEKQVLGKTYEVLGIPAVCGKPDKYFLKAYKRYKPYYPVRYPKNEKTPIDVSCNVIYDVTETKTTKHRQEYSTPNLSRTSPNYLELYSSTPITKIMSTFEINSLISPINTLIEDDSNIQNMAQKSLNYDKNKQILESPKLSGFNVFNTSQQALRDEQKVNITEANNNLSSSQSEIYFISRHPENVKEYNNDTSKSDEYDSSDVLNEKSFNRETKYTSIYFNASKKVEYKKTPTYSQEKNPFGTKKSLNEKIKKNLSLKHLKEFSRTRKTVKMPNLKRAKQETVSHSKLNISESSKEIEQTFSDFSFSDSEKTSETLTNIFINKIEQNLTLLEHNNTPGQNKKNWNMDMESKSNNMEESLSGISSMNSFFINMNNSSNHKEFYKYKPSSTFDMSSITFSDDSILQPNLTDCSHQLRFCKQEFTKWSDDSVKNNDEQRTNDNLVTDLFNNE